MNGGLPREVFRGAYLPRLPGEDQTSHNLPTGPSRLGDEHTEVRVVWQPVPDAGLPREDRLVNIPNYEVDSIYLMSIATTYLYPAGGDFDDADTIWADIVAIGVDPVTDTDIPPGPGGVGAGPNRVGISTYIGPIK